MELETSEFIWINMDKTNIFRFFNYNALTDHIVPGIDKNIGDIPEEITVRMSVFRIVNEYLVGIESIEEEKGDDEQSHDQRMNWISDRQH